MIEVIRQAQWDRRSQYKTILPDFLWISKLVATKDKYSAQKCKRKVPSPSVLSNVEVDLIQGQFLYAGL